MNPDFFHSSTFQWVVLPLLIFLARMSDVTLATLRNIFLSKSVKYIVPFLGFFEVLIWLLAISQIMKNLQNPACFLAYAGGYSMGIFVGIKIEERLALGLQIMRIITHQDCDDLVAELAVHNFGMTIMDAMGSKGPVKVILTVVKRKEIPLVSEIILRSNKNAFFSVEDVRNVSHGVFRNGNGDGGLENIKRMFPYGGAR